MMAGSAMSFLGMIWWMVGKKTFFGTEVKMDDTGFGAWFHLILALVLMALSHTIYTIERDLDYE